MASRRWLRGQSDVTVSLSAPRPLTTLGASRSTGPFDEVRRVYGDFATALGRRGIPVTVTSAKARSTPPAALCDRDQIRWGRPGRPQEAGGTSGAGRRSQAVLVAMLTLQRGGAPPPGGGDGGLRRPVQGGDLSSCIYRPLTVEVTRSIRSQAPVLPKERSTACHGNGTRRSYQQSPVTPAVRSL